MKVLKVAWHDGPWSHGVNEVQPVQTAKLDPRCRVGSVSEDNLVFRLGDEVQLVIPGNRLISAVLIDVEAGA